MLYYVGLLVSAKYRYILDTLIDGIFKFRYSTASNIVNVVSKFKKKLSNKIENLNIHTLTGLNILDV